MKVVVTGGREYSNYERVCEVLDELHGTGKVITLIATGAAKGADALAERWAKENEIVYLGVPAKWKTGSRGKGEGYVRNGILLNMVQPDLVVALPGGPGTANCVLQAHKNHFSVREIQ